LPSEGKGHTFELSGGAKAAEGLPDGINAAGPPGWWCNANFWRTPIAPYPGSGGQPRL